MKAEITTITPQMAKNFLKRNDRNRSIRKNSVQRYARDMARGNWDVNGQTIIVNGRTLIDGQHRLLACIEADVPFKTVLVTGVNTDTIVSVDSGMKRSLSDVLTINGMDNAQALAATAYLGWKWDTGNLVGNVNPTNTEAIEWINANPSVNKAISLAIPIRYNPLRAPTAAMSLIALKAIANGMESDAEEFFSHLESGEGLHGGSPILQLRNMFIRNSTNTVKLRRIAVFARAIKAWNAYIQGEDMKKLAWRPTHTTKGESFPVMLNAEGYPISFVDVPESE